MVEKTAACSCLYPDFYCYDEFLQMQKGFLCQGREYVNIHTPAPSKLKDPHFPL